MRALTSNDADLLSHFDNIDETQNGGNNTSLEQMLNNNHTDANRGKIKGHIPLGHIYGFFKTFEKITKNICFHLTFRTNDLKGILFTTLGDDINETINSLYLFVPVIIPITETQVTFNESIKNKYTITYDSWYTERKLSTDGNELRVDIGSAQNVDSPKNLIGAFQTLDTVGAFQTLDTVGAHNKNNSVAIFDDVNVKKYFLEIDGYRYPKDAVLTNFPENDYLDQYRDLKLFFKEYVEEELMNPFINYIAMKNKYRIQVIDLRHQIHHITPQKIQLFEEFNTDPAKVKARLFVILIRHRQIEMFSDGDKSIEITVIQMKILSFGDFMKKI